MTKATRSLGVALSLLFVAACSAPVGATDASVPTAMSEAELVRYLNNPVAATGVRYDLKDSAGNPMHLPSVVELRGQRYKYAAVYHTPYPVGGGARFKVNLAASSDLMVWHHIGLLADNADMAKLEVVPGSDWLVLTHEQWLGRSNASTSPARLAFKLFHNSADLMGRTVRAAYLMPPFQSRLNGTPSTYALNLSYEGGRPVLSGTFGFHYWNGSRDVNAAMQLTGLFRPAAPRVRPIPVAGYNALFRARGVSGNIGDRDTLVTTSGRYSVQEGNLGEPAGSWDKWRLFLYKFAERSSYPDGSGRIVALAPRTHGGSKSFGNPSFSVVERPAGGGKALVVSYFLFSEGAAPGEAGSLLYYYNL